MTDPLPPELARLLAAAQGPPHHAAWGAFVATYSKLLLHTARSLGGDQDTVMDRYAYVLEQLRRNDCQRLRGYAADRRSKFTTWLVVVARRLCLDHHRHRYGRDRSVAESDTRQQAHRSARRQLTDLIGAEVDPDTLESGSGDPEHELRALELRTVLDQALTALEPRDRLLLRLRFEDELSAPEIARVMEFATPFHVYRRLNHLFEALRRTLVREGIEDPVP